MNILVVDNDQSVRDYLKQALKDMGHTVTVVSDGYDAIDYAREHDINLAYIDISMPGIDGFETLKRLREIDPKISGVMISGQSVEKIADAPLESGIYVCLNKPFSLEEIEEINTSFEEVKGPLEFIYENPYGLDLVRISGAGILVVDDEEEIVSIITESLEEDGFTNIDPSYDGRNAIELFNEKRHDVVIVDIVMPHKSGIEVLRHVKALSSNSQVIIITANADKDSAVLALKLGAYDFIEKPLTLDVVTRITRRAVEKKLLLDEQGVA